MSAGPWPGASQTPTTTTAALTAPRLFPLNLRQGRADALPGAAQGLGQAVEAGEHRAQRQEIVLIHRALGGGQGELAQGVGEIPLQGGEAGPGDGAAQAMLDEVKAAQATVAAAEVTEAAAEATLNRSLHNARNGYNALVPKLTVIYPNRKVFVNTFFLDRAKDA